MAEGSLIVPDDHPQRMNPIVVVSPLWKRDEHTDAMVRGAASFVRDIPPDDTAREVTRAEKYRQVAGGGAEFS